MPKLHMLGDILHWDLVLADAYTRKRLSWTVRFTTTYGEVSVTRVPVGYPTGYKTPPSPRWYAVRIYLA